MAAIEARRFARHPLFIIGALAAYGVQLWNRLDNDHAYITDLLSQPIIPAFFIGVTSLVVAARLTTSTDVAVEAMGSAPGTEARRTLAVTAASIVPLSAGLLWLVEFFVLNAIKGPHPAELWFGNLNDAHVWSILLGLGVVSCAGGALLGVLVGRWLRFPGAPVVAVIALVVGTMSGQLFYAYDPDLSQFRVWVPWAMFHTGTMSDGKEFEGIPGFAQAVLPGNPVFYLLYLLALGALAVGGAVWHDKAARTRQLRLALYGVIAVALVFLALAMFTGIDGLVISDPLPFLVAD
jgi:hypothetical protein